MDRIRPLFVYFYPFDMTNITQIDYNDKSVYGVLGTQTRGGRMVGADESTAIAAPQDIWELLFGLFRRMSVYLYLCGVLNIYHNS